MTSSLRWISYDCADPESLAGFYAAVTGWTADPENEPDECGLLPPAPGHPGLLFTRVPEGKTVKNRLHLDLQPTDRTRDEEVERLTALGATFLADFRGTHGRGWVVLADPEGNEFCVNTSPAERGEQAL
jgi:predicted enzyme related to lactoylglutathione lyase